MNQDGIGSFNPESGDPTEFIADWSKPDEELKAEATAENEVQLAVGELKSLVTGIEKQLVLSEAEKAEITKAIESLGRLNVLKKDSLTTSLQNVGDAIQGLNQIKAQAEQLIQRVGQEPTEGLAEEVKALDATYFSAKTNNDTIPAPEHYLPEALINTVNEAVRHLELSL
jgi:hypothetical protein